MATLQEMDQGVRDWIRRRVQERSREAATVGRAYFDPASQQMTSRQVGFPVYYDPMNNRATLEETNIPFAIPAHRNVNTSRLWAEYGNLMTQQMEQFGGPETFFDIYSKSITLSPTQYPVFWDQSQGSVTFNNTGVPFRYQEGIDPPINQAEFQNSFVQNYAQATDLRGMGLKQLHLKIGSDQGMELTTDFTPYPVFIDPQTGNPTMARTGQPFIPGADTIFDEAQSAALLSSFLNTYGLKDFEASQTWIAGKLYFDLATGGFSLEKSRYPVYSAGGKPTFTDTGIPFQYNSSNEEAIRDFSDLMHDEFFETYGRDPIALMEMGIFLDTSIYRNLTYEESAKVRMYGEDYIDDIVRQRMEAAMPIEVIRPSQPASTFHSRDPAFDGEIVWSIESKKGPMPLSQTGVENFARGVETAHVGGVSPQGGGNKGYLPFWDFFNASAQFFAHLWKREIIDFGHITRIKRIFGGVPHIQEKVEATLDELNRLETGEEMEQKLISLTISEPTADPESFAGKLRSAWDNFLVKTNRATFNAWAMDLIPVDVDAWDDVGIGDIDKLQEAGREIEWMYRKDFREHRADAHQRAFRDVVALWNEFGDNWIADVLKLPSEEEVRARMLEVPQGELRLFQRETEWQMRDKLIELRKKTGLLGDVQLHEEFSTWLRENYGLTEEDLQVASGLTNPSSVRMLALKASEKYSREVIWERAQGHYLIGLGMLEAGRRTEAIEELEKAVKADMAGGRGLFSPFNKYTIEWNETRRERFMTDLVYITAEVGRPLSNDEVWYIARNHEDPFFEGFMEIASEMILVFPNVLAAGIFKGLFLGMRTLGKLPAKAFRFGGGRLKIPIIKQLYESTTWLLQDSSRTIRSLARDDMARGMLHLIDQSKLGIEDLSKTMFRFAKAVEDAPDVHSVVRGIEQATPGQPGRSPALQRIMARLFFTIENHYQMLQTKIPKVGGVNPLEKWRAKNISQTIDNAINRVREVEYNRVFDLQINNGIAEKAAEEMANKAANKAGRNRVLISQEISEELYQDMGRASRPIAGLDLYDDSFLYKLMESFDLTGRDARAYHTAVKAWLNVHGWVKNIWIFQVLAGRPAWVVRNIIDSEFRYLIAGGSLFDDLGKVTELTFGKIFGKTAAYFSSAEAFGRALPGVDMSWARRIIAGEYAGKGVRKLLFDVFNESYRHQWDIARGMMQTAGEKQGIGRLTQFFNGVFRTGLTPYIGTGVALKDINSIAEYGWRIRLIHKAGTDIFQKAERITMTQLDLLGRQSGLSTDMTKRLMDVYRGSYDNPEKILELLKNVRDGKLENVVIASDLVPNEVLAKINYLRPHEQDELIKPIIRFFEDQILTAAQRNEVVTSDMIRAWGKTITQAVDEELLNKASHPIQTIKNLKMLSNREDIARAMSNTEEVVDVADIGRIENLAPDPRIRHVETRIAETLDEPSHALRRIIQARKSTTGTEFAADWGTAVKGTGVNVSFVDLPENQITRIARGSTELGNEGTVWLQVDLDKLSRMKVTDAQDAVTRGTVEWMMESDSARVATAVQDNVFGSVDEVMDGFLSFLKSPAKLRGANPSRFDFFVEQLGRIDGSIDMLTASTGRRLEVLGMADVIDTSTALKAVFDLGDEELTRVARELVRTGNHIPQSTMDAFKTVRRSRAELGDAIQTAIDAGNTIQASYLQSTNRFLSRLLGDMYGGRLGSFFREVVPGPMTKTGAHRARAWDDFFQMGEMVSRTINKFARDSMDIAGTITEATRIDLSHMDILRSIGMKLEFDDSGVLTKLLIPSTTGRWYASESPVSLGKFIRTLFSDIPGTDDPANARRLLEMSWADLSDAARGIERAAETVQTAARKSEYIQGLKRSFRQHFKGRFAITDESVDATVDMVDEMFEGLIKTSGLSKDEFWTRYAIGVERAAYEGVPLGEFLDISIDQAKGLANMDLGFFAMGMYGGNEAAIQNVGFHVEHMFQQFNTALRSDQGSKIITALMRSKTVSGLELGGEIIRSLGALVVREGWSIDDPLIRAVSDNIGAVMNYNGLVSGDDFMHAVLKALGRPQFEYLSRSALASHGLDPKILAILKWAANAAEAPDLLPFLDVTTRTSKLTIKNFSDVVQGMTDALQAGDMIAAIKAARRIKGIDRNEDALKFIHSVLGVDDTINLTQRVGDRTLWQLFYDGTETWSTKDADAINTWASKIVNSISAKVTRELDQEIFAGATSIRAMRDSISSALAHTRPSEYAAEAMSSILQTMGARSISRRLVVGSELWKWSPKNLSPNGIATYGTLSGEDGIIGMVSGILGLPQEPNAILHEMVHGLHDIVKIMSREGIPGADYLMRDLDILSRYISKEFVDDVLTSSRRLGREDPYFSTAIEFITRSSEAAVSEGWLGVYRLQQASYRVREFFNSIPDFNLYQKTILNPKMDGLREVNGKPIYESVLDLFVYSEGNVDDLLRARIGSQKTITKALGSDEFLMHPSRMDYRLISETEELRRLAEGETLGLIDELGKKWVKLSTAESALLENLRPDAIRDAVLRPKVYRAMRDGLDELGKVDPEFATSIRIYASHMENELMALMRDQTRLSHESWWGRWADRAVYRRFQEVPDSRQAYHDLVYRLREFIHGKPIDYGAESSLLRQAFAKSMEDGLVTYENVLPPNPILLRRLNYHDEMVREASQQWEQVISSTRWSRYLKSFSEKPRTFEDFVKHMSDEMVRLGISDRAWKMERELWDAWINSQKFGNQTLLEVFGLESKDRLHFLRHIDNYISDMSKVEGMSESFLDAIRLVRSYAANFDFIKQTLGDGLKSPFLPSSKYALPVPWPTWRQPHAWQTWLGHNVNLAGRHETFRTVSDMITENLVNVHARKGMGVVRIPEDQADNVANWLNRAYGEKVDNMLLSFEGNINPGSAAFGRFADDLSIGQTKGAIKIAGDNMLDYRQTSVMDEALKSIIPFWMFPSRSIVYWIGMLERHPELLTWYNKFISASTREVRQEGLVTTRGEPMPSLVGKIRIPGTNMWFDPVQVLSFRFFIPRPWVLDRVSGRYDDEDGLSFDRAVKRATSAAEFFGFHALPWAKGYLEGATGEESGLEQFTFFPVTELVPPWYAETMRANLRKTIFRSLADSPLWAPEYQFLDQQIERRMLSKALQDIEATEDLAEKARIAEEARHAMGYFPKYDYNGEYIGYEVDINRTHDRWQEARMDMQTSQYNLLLVGYFTGFYGREFSDADVQLYDMRHDMNLLREGINNEILQEAYFPKDLGPDELYQMYVNKRYDTAEGEIYDLAGSLSFVRTPSGDAIDDPTERRQRQIELIDQNERESAFWNSIEALNEQLQEDLARVPVGDVDTKRLYLDAFFLQRAAIDENPMFAEARRSWTFGYKPTTMIEQHFVDLAFQMYRETRPVRQDDENFNMYRTRLRAWEEQFDEFVPDIIRAVTFTLTDLATGYVVEDNTIMLANRELHIGDLMTHVKTEATFENFQKWWRSRDTVYDALDMAYQENYANAYWDHVQGAPDRFDRETRSREFFAQGKPDAEQMVEWVSEMYEDQFPESAIRHAFEAKGGAISMEERLSPGTKEEGTVEDVWNMLLWAGPSLSQLRKEIENVGGRSSDVDVWYATNGNPKSWGSELSFQKFYNALQTATEKMGLSEPTTAELTEWSHVRDLNDKFHRFMRETLGEEVQIIITRYYNMSGEEQKDYQADHPEIDQYLILRDAYAVQFPTWAKYFHERAYREIQEGKTPYWLEKAGKASTGTSAQSGGYRPRSSSGGAGLTTSSAESQEIDRFVPMGYRASIDPGYLTPHRLGAGGRGGRIKAPVLPTRLVKAIGEEGVEEISDLVDNGEVISDALESLLNKSKQRYPDLIEVVDEILEINKKRRKAYIDRS